MKKKIYEPKFLINYKIPGFYNFYKNISDIINKKMTMNNINKEIICKKYNENLNIEEYKEKEKKFY